MRSLRFGSTGPAVELLQLGLNRAGFGPLEQDGVFGPATRGAVSRVQAVNRLHPDGIAGPATQQAMLPWLYPAKARWSREAIKPASSAVGA